MSDFLIDTVMPHVRYMRDLRLGMIAVVIAVAGDTYEESLARIQVVREVMPKAEEFDRKEKTKKLIARIGHGLLDEAWEACGKLMKLEEKHD